MPSPSGSTAKFGFPYLEESDAPDIATAMQDLAQGVENIISTWYSGTWSEIPTAGKSGRHYYATDLDVTFFDTGSAWSCAPGSILASTVVNSGFSADPVSFTLVSSSTAKLQVPIPASGKILLTEAATWNNGVAGVRIDFNWSTEATNNANLIGTGINTGDIDDSSYVYLEHPATGLTADPGTLQTFYLQWAYSNAAGEITSVAPLVLKAIAL